VCPLILFSGPGSEQIGSEIAEILGIGASVVEHRIFPDGESYVRLTTEVKGRDVVLVHSTAPPQDRRLVQILLMLDTLREREPNSIVVVSPYMAYARQDRRRLPGEAVSIYTVIRLLRFMGVSRLITVNVHNPAVFEGSGLELTDLSAIPLLARHMSGEGFGGSFSLSLGKKPVDIEHAREAAFVLGGGYGCLETFRDPTTGIVSLGGADFDVDSRRVIVFDDVVTSGGTHIGAAELLRERGAEEVHLACVHSLLSGVGLEVVLGRVDGFVCTDTIPNPYGRVKVAPLVSEAILRLNWENERGG
jgi:ribose-phosphate pyrophosphokinase